MIDANKLIEVIEAAGYDVRSYSGHGMCGAQCVGFETDNPVKAVAEIVGEVAIGRDRREIVAAFCSASADSMGRGTIIYFPRVEWPAGRADSDGDEDAA